MIGKLLGLWVICREHLIPYLWLKIPGPVSYTHLDDVDVKNERRLAKAISRLSGRQREILYLYYVKELSHQEISAILGISNQNPKNNRKLAASISI